MQKACTRSSTIGPQRNLSYDNHVASWLLTAFAAPLKDSTVALGGASENWSAYGGTSDETRFSKLTQINDRAYEQFHDSPWNLVISDDTRPLQTAGFPPVRYV
jgi:glucose dehydrogenase